MNIKKTAKSFEIPLVKQSIKEHLQLNGAEWEKYDALFDVSKYAILLQVKTNNRESVDKAVRKLCSELIFNIKIEVEFTEG